MHNIAVINAKAIWMEYVGLKSEICSGDFASKSTVIETPMTAPIWRTALLIAEPTA